MNTILRTTANAFGWYRCAEGDDGYDDDYNMCVCDRVMHLLLTLQAHMHVPNASDCYFTVETYVQCSCPAVCVVCTCERYYEIYWMAAHEIELYSIYEFMHRWPCQPFGMSYVDRYYCDHTRWNNHWNKTYVAVCPLWKCASPIHFSSGQREEIDTDEKAAVEFHSVVLDVNFEWLNNIRTSKMFKKFKNDDRMASDDDWKAWNGREHAMLWYRMSWPRP